MDDIYAFFQNCYHLRYWILVSHLELQKKLDTLFIKNVELQICKDICNGLKHLELTKPKIDKDFNIYREYNHFAVSGENPVKYNVRADEYKYELFELMGNLIDIWDTFIKDHLYDSKTGKKV